MKFGQYELLERVAVGGMAEVYRGRVAGAEGFEKWVAIKRILPEFARDERFISMMLTEARIHSALSHRNIVQIHDLGISEDGEYFIVLEYVEGHDLRAIMEAAAELGVQIPDSLALHVADELAQALHFAHELTDPEGQPLGIIHRDVSPSNVLISNSGEVKLSDFGIAKRRNDHSFVGSLKGNLVYMSPEQARRVPLDRRTDVFSLGAVLFEMLTGHKLRDIADEVSGFRDVASGLVRSARALRPDLPEAYEALLTRALASDPADRFPDAAAFGTAIRALGREHDAPVGPADMKELIEVLNPPRRARSPVERSKVIRLGPDFKALAGPPRAARPGEPQPTGDQPSVILAPGMVPVAPQPAPLTNGGGNGGTPGWADSAAARLAASTLTPLPPSTLGHPSLSKATPPPLNAMEPTPPPPLIPPPPPLRRATGGARGASFDAAEAALHALEFSAGSDMQPTPPPPAGQSPFAPDVVTPLATPVPAERLPVNRPAEHPAAHLVASEGRGRPGGPVDFTATDMAMSMPTPPPRTATASFPGQGKGMKGMNGQSAHRPSAPAVAPMDAPPLSVSLSGPHTGGEAAAAAAWPAQRQRAWPAIALAVVVVLCAATAGVHYKVMPLQILAVWTKPTVLDVNSRPRGASVTLDGRSVPGLTPLRVDVRRDRDEHVLEFTRPGSLPMRTTVRFDKSVALAETATLPDAPPPPPPVVPAAPAVAATPVPEAPAPSQPETARPGVGGQGAKRLDKKARKAARLSARKSAAKQLISKKKAKKKARAAKASKTTKATKGAASDAGEL